MTVAHNTNAKLGKCEKANGELAEGNNSHSRDGRPVYFVLEGNVNPRDAEESGLSLVYPNPQPSNFSYARKGTPH